MGPLGMDKLLVDKMGNSQLTNDGASILKMSQDRDPIARMITEVAKSQEETAFDGTTSTIIILGELLDKGDELVEMGVHPNAVTKGYRRALEIAIESAREHAQESLTPYEAAIKVARTAITGKSAEDYIELLADVCAKAAEMAEPNNIKLIGRPGNPLDTELIEGVVILKQNIYATDETEFEGRILLIDEEIAPPVANINLADPEKIIVSQQ